MKNYIVRGTAAEGQIRCFAADTTAMVYEATTIHGASPVVAAALGRTLTMAGMMGSLLKADDDIITIKIQGSGPMKGLIVTVDSKGNVKGYPYVNNVDIPSKANGKLDVSGALGIGILTVIRDLGLKEPYVGQLELISGEIAEDFTYYYLQSEQTPSAIGLGVLTQSEKIIEAAGGYMIQLMPGCEEDVIVKLEERIATAPPITEFLQQGKTPQQILEYLLGDLGLEILEEQEVGYYCNCSKERFAKGLVSLGKKEIEQIIEEDEKAEAKCHFCNSAYHFSKEELQVIADSI